MKVIGNTLFLAMFLAASLLPGLHPLNASASIQGQGTKMFSVDEVREDLVYLRDVWAPVDQSFNATERGEFNRLIDEALNRGERLDRGELLLSVSKAVAAAQNGHSRVFLPGWLHRLPFEVAWFDDGLYVIRSHPQYERFLGGKIEKFGLLTSDQALARVAEYIPGNPARVKDLSAEYLMREEILLGIGAGASKDGTVGINLEVRLQSGKRKLVQIDALPRLDSDAKIIWSDLLSRVNVRPLASRSFSSVSSQWLGDDHQLLYVQCNTLRGDGLADGSGAVAMELMSIVETQLLPHRPKNVVFDLRQNGGGNLFNAVMFSQAVPHVIAKGGKVYVLIGPKTFSAAIATAAMLKGAGGDQIIIAGRTVGDTLKFWAEGRPFILPNSKLKVWASTKLHDWSEGCVNTEHCFWGNAAYASKNVFLEPELTVTENFEDYASGRDRLLEQIVFLANSDQQGLDQ